MRVGLVRHFPVSEAMPRGWLTAQQLQDWRERYDNAPVDYITPSGAAEIWARCYSSDLRRAFVTASAIHGGAVVQTPLLREPEIRQFRTGNLTLPFWVWRWILRFAWMTGHLSQRSARDDFTRRVQQVADLIESSEDGILLVSHAGMMAYLRRELLRRGFEGPKFTIADHAKIYVFEKTSAPNINV